MTKARISLPPRWALGQLTLFFEGEDLTNDPDPMAATVIVSLRPDVPSDVPLADVVKKDLEKLRGMLNAVSVVGSGTMRLGAQEAPYLEIQFRDGGGRSLQQLTLFLRIDQHAYMVTGTHRAGERFTNVRPSIVEVAKNLLQ